MVIVNTIIKNFFMVVYAYYVATKIVNQKYTKNQYLLQFITSLLISLIYTSVKLYTDLILGIMTMYFLFSLCIKIIMKKKIGYSMILALISLAICFIALVASVVISYIFQTFLYRFEFKEIVIMDIILIIQGSIVFALFRIKRFKKGFTFLQNKIDSDYMDIIMINISAVVVLAYCLLGDYYGNLTRNILFSFIIIAIIMLIMIQKALTLCYKQKQLIKTIEDYEKQIDSKDKEIDKISQEKFKISKLNHDFYNRQKSLELKVQEIVSKANLNMETSSELSVIDQINNLTKEYSEKMEEIKSADKLPSTDIEEIDDMFKYMQSECKKNNIDFKLQINGNIHHLVNTIIPQNKLVTLIGDHIRDAIIAVNSSSNTYKSIIAILDIKENTYEFCVYDTGIEFEIGTLLKLGLEPATTHKETGGTGIGFMTTFETLKETNASLIIEEKHEMTDNDYTKAVIIRFDGKHEYKIRSYRANKIRKSDRIIIEKI